MENVICDTMIWYYLGNENSNPKRINITPELVKGKNLILTGLVIHELCFSERAVSDTKTWVSANNAAIKYSGEKIIQTEFDCILNIKKSPYKQQIQSKYNEMFKVTELSIPILTKEQINQGLVHFRDIKTNTFQYGTSIFKKFRDDYINSFTTKNDRNASVNNTYKSGLYKNSIKEFILQFSKEYLKINNLDESQAERINWDNHAFFLNVFEKFHEQFLKGQYKMENNDWNDLFNMLYVMPNNKYWTEEKKWRDIIESDPITKSFLYY